MVSAKQRLMRLAFWALFAPAQWVSSGGPRVAAISAPSREAPNRRIWLCCSSGMDATNRAPFRDGGEPSGSPICQAAFRENRLGDAARRRRFRNPHFGLRKWTVERNPTALLAGGNALASAQVTRHAGLFGEMPPLR